jgi:hypothetical protein
MKEATMRFSFFTSKVVFGSGLESGTPWRTGPPEILCREMDPAIPLPAAGEGVDDVSAPAAQQTSTNKIRNSSNDIEWCKGESDGI